jgi:mannose-6-phosphate isomerase-like protein (cupin superfamily)
MKATIKRQDLESEYFTEEQCYIVEVSNTSDDPDLSIARARLKPGVTTHWHRLKGASERYIIVSGSGLVELDGLNPTQVEAGDVVIIPPQCHQRITNIGTEDLIFYALCTPRFSNQIYEDTE